MLQQVDAPQRLYDRPENLFVAGFIGTPPMNLLEATAIVNGDVSDRSRREHDPDRARGARAATRACASTTAAR